MQVQISKDSHTDIDSAAVTSSVERGLSRFASRLTRVEVHVSDVNGPKGGPDARCALETRPAGRNPVAVTNDAGNANDAVKGAIEKMSRLLTTTFEKESEAKGGVSASDCQRKNNFHSAKQASSITSIVCVSARKNLSRQVSTRCLFNFDRSVILREDVDVDPIRQHD